MSYSNNLLSTPFSNFLRLCARPRFTRISEFLFSYGINDWDSTVGTGGPALSSHALTASKLYTFFSENYQVTLRVLFYGSTALVGPRPPHCR